MCLVHAVCGTSPEDAVNAVQNVNIFLEALKKRNGRRSRRRKGGLVVLNLPVLIVAAIAHVIA